MGLADRVRRDDSDNDGGDEQGGQHVKKFLASKDELGRLT